MTTKKNKHYSPPDLPNHEMVVLALHVCGGQFDWQDIEDIAIEAHRLAPSRFSWKKYKDHIDKDTVRVALTDAAKPKNGQLVLGNLSKGWKLTESGLSFADQNVKHLSSRTISKSRLDKKEKIWLEIEKSRLKSDETFSKFKKNGVNSISEQDAERFFRIDDYIIGNARQERLLRYLNFLGNDPVLGPAVRELSRKVRKR